MACQGGRRAASEPEPRRSRRGSKRGAPSLEQECGPCAGPTIAARIASLIALGLVVGIPSPAAARLQDDPPDYRLVEELPSSPVTVPSRRSVARWEGEGRTELREVVRRPSVHGGQEVVLEVLEETVRVDPLTVRRTRRELRPDPNGGSRLARTVEERREEGPDGRLRVSRTISVPDPNGRLRTLRREVMTTVPLGGGVHRTEVETSVPDLHGRGLVAVERIEQTERREGEELVEAERTTYRRPVGAPRWRQAERHVTEREREGGEVRTVERVYRPDGRDRLSLNDRIVTREWRDAGGAERLVQEVHSTDIPHLARSSAPGLYRKVEVVRERGPDGSRRVAREVRERGMNGFRLVERTIEESRPTPGGTETVRTVQRPDGNGRLRTVSVSRADESGS